MVMYIVLPWLINLKDMGRWNIRKFFLVYLLIVVLDGISRWFSGTLGSIGLDLFGLSIGLWCISESLYRFWSPSFRIFSGLIGFLVCAFFGIFPSEIVSNIDQYWWVILFWIPGLFASNTPRNSRSYSPWFILGMTSYLTAFIIWLQGVPTSSYCNPDSFIQPHGIWHLMAAFSTWCFFKFYRTERKKS